MTTRVKKILEGITLNRVEKMLQNINLSEKGGVGSGIYDHLKRGGEHYKTIPKIKREMDDYQHDIATPKSEVNAMHQYQAKGYIEINGRLRFEDSLGDKEKTVNNISNYITNAPKYSGTVYRGMEFTNDADYNTFKNSITTGSLLTDKGFMSTTTDKGIMKNFESAVKVVDKNTTVSHVEMEIDGKNGVYVAGTAPYDYQNENEVLFNRNTTLKVVSVNEDLKVGEKTLHIKLQEV